MFGYVKSFEVEPGGLHVLMTCWDPGENQYVEVRVSKSELETMFRARPSTAPSGPPQTPTRVREVPS